MGNNQAEINRKGQNLGARERKRPKGAEAIARGNFIFNGRGAARVNHTIIKNTGEMSEKRAISIFRRGGRTREAAIQISFLEGRPNKYARVNNMFNIMNARIITHVRRNQHIW